MNAAKNIGLVMVLSTIARGMSLLAGIMYTTHFGLGNLELDIYSYAVTLPNLVFTCIGTALFTVVIPIYAGRLAENKTEQASVFADNVITVSLVFSFVIAIAGFFAAPGIVGLNNRFSTGNWGFANYAIRVMFPVVVFHSLNHIFQAILQSNSRFVMPALVSMANGAAIIVYMLLFADTYGVPGLLVATFIGLSIQAVILIPPTRAAGYKYKPRLGLANEDLRKAGKLALPILVSSSSYQLNMFINANLATAFMGGVVTITTTQNLAFTAAHLFILSTLAVMFPKMSAQTAVGDMEGFRGSFIMVLKLIIYFAIPASLGLAVTSGHLITLLYGYGRMTGEGVRLMTAAFAVYASAIASIGFKEAVDRTFYAMKDSITPTVVSIIIMALNVSLSLILKGPMGIVGLPVAYTVSITAGAILLLILVRKKTGPLSSSESGESIKTMLVKCLISGIIMALAILLVNGFLFSGTESANGTAIVESANGTIGMESANGTAIVESVNGAAGMELAMPVRAFRLIIIVAVGCVVYFLATLAFKVEQAQSILRIKVKGKAKGKA